MRSAAESSRKRLSHVLNASTPDAAQAVAADASSPNSNRAPAAFDDDRGRNTSRGRGT